MIMLAVLALLVFGPESLPDIAKTVVRTMRAFRQASMDLQNEVREALEIENKQRKETKIAKTDSLSGEDEVFDPKEAKPAETEDEEEADDLEATEQAAGPSEGSVEVAAESESVVEELASPTADDENDVVVDDDDDGPGLPMTKPTVAPETAASQEAEPEPSAEEPKPVETAS